MSELITGFISLALGILIGYAWSEFRMLNGKIGEEEKRHELEERHG